MKYKKILSWVLLSYVAITIYGSIREFQDALNMSSTVTPIMLKEMFEAILAYMFFVVILVGVHKDL